MLLSLEENFQITQHITHRFNVGGTAVQKLKHPGLPKITEICLIKRAGAYAVSI